MTQSLSGSLISGGCSRRAICRIVKLRVFSCVLKNIARFSSSVQTFELSEWNMNSIRPTAIPGITTKKNLGMRRVLKYIAHLSPSFGLLE